MKKEAGEGGRWRRRQAEKEAGREGGRRRRRPVEEEAGLSLLTTAIKTNEELITRIENNLQQVKNEPQNKLRNLSLGDTDKQLWTLFACITLEQLELNTEDRVAEREKRKTPTLTPTGSSKTNTGGKNKGKGKGKNNLGILQTVTDRHYTPMQNEHHINTWCIQEYIVELNSASTESQVKGSEPEPTTHTNRT